MIAPSLPSNEGDRLKDLYALNILDTAEEERFSRITRTAQKLFKVPIATLSFVDKDRQWFKACRGLNASETSRDVSFCGHTIHKDDIFVVEDTRLDARFADNPLVTGEPFIRFYAGVPVRGPHGCRVGTLCIIDSEPREFNNQDQQALTDLAKWAALELNSQDLSQALASREKIQEELVRSNQELEHFAYVASHDLQEPLRKIFSFIQLFEKKYKGKLDDKADHYIHYIVDGAKRMQVLISDILIYSRLSTKNHSFRIVDCNKIVDDVLDAMEFQIQDQNAVINNEELPEVIGDASQVRQVFQNFIANAIKFKGPESPKIKISATMTNGETDNKFWEFAVSDNGIGIDPEFHERIFKMFQRLHSREEYPGTGIGLSICKKVVDNHGGRLRVESELGTGSTFYFTLPCAAT